MQINRDRYHPSLPDREVERISTSIARYEPDQVAVAVVEDHCLATVPYPNRVLAFSGAFALQAVLAGRKVRDPDDNRTNLYILGLAQSSAGKDRPRKLNTEILYAAGVAV